MNKISNLINKEEHLAVGLMSGTSMDGVDAVLLTIENVEDNPRLKPIVFQSHPYPTELKRSLSELVMGMQITADELAVLNTSVAVAFATAFSGVCRAANIDPENIDFIGSHGQTVAHVPPGGEQSVLAGTLQLGPPTMIAALTGVTTVGDFRTGDMAVGGQGAPLAPFADYLLRRSNEMSRIILNIGGIANITYLPRSCASSEVIAFDTGPGNMVIDELFRVLYPGKGDYDDGGAVAAAGTVSDFLLSELLENAYYKLAPPKSTGHREFGPQFAWQLNADAEATGTRSQDVIATATELTVVTIADAINRYILADGELDEIYLTGGGAHNKVIVSGLRRMLSDVDILPVDDLGVPGDAKEAVDFAVLARETLFARENVLPSATGAARALSLGAIAWGDSR